MAGLGTLPGASSVLASTPGSSATQTGTKKKATGPYQPAAQPGTQAPNSSQPQTFAQMQSQGIARPAPPAPNLTTSGATGGGTIPGQGATTQPVTRTPPPTGPANDTTPTQQIPDWHTLPTTGANPGQTPPPTGGATQDPIGGGGTGSTLPPGGVGTTPGAPSSAVDSALQSRVLQSLQNPGRYDLPQVQQVKDALTQQIEQQFNGSRKQLEENMASRGLSASSYGQGYYGDLQGQEDTALANMNADVIKDAAATNAGDLSASIGAGQNYQNSQTSNNQFQQSLAQALGISQMQNDTSRYGIDVNNKLAQNDLMLKVASVLSSMGYPDGSTNTVPNTGQQPVPGATGSEPGQPGYPVGLGDPSNGGTSPANQSIGPRTPSSFGQSVMQSVGSGASFPTGAGTPSGPVNASSTVGQYNATLPYQSDYSRATTAGTTPGYIQDPNDQQAYQSLMNKINTSGFQSLSGDEQAQFNYLRTMGNSTGTGPAIGGKTTGVYAWDPKTMTGDLPPGAGTIAASVKRKLGGY